ncbi:MAG: hypothetical protein RL885_32145 [Planctomycetota bacterium]
MRLVRSAAGIVVAGLCTLSATAQERVTGESISRSLYFDWINSQYEGTTEAHTLANMEVFLWLHDEYGMALDFYSLDVGNVDDGPYTAGVGRLIPAHYGDLSTPSFREQFPRGFGPLAERAARFGARLGIWLGPDGFGRTPDDEAARTELLVSLVRDHGFGLFKFDAVAGGLREEKQRAFENALEICRQYRPDLVVLNERIELGSAADVVTTNLWEGQETYIDVFNWNEVTAPHHRAGALARGLPPRLDRTFEDHGVCLSSCLDGWDDDLVLQAFNRASLLAPEIYGSPWLLRDDELVRLARLFNLHRRARAELVSAKRLLEIVSDPDALARGNGQRRWITLRNLSWEPVTIPLRLDDSSGLTASGPFEVRRFHPREKVLGRHPRGATIPVVVEPFRSCLVLISATPIDEIGLIGCEYEVVRDVPGRPVILDALGLPGTRARIAITAGGREFRTATVDGVAQDDLLADGAELAFEGEALREPWRRPLGSLSRSEIPGDVEALLEATAFASDSNALEVRSRDRSGPSSIPTVVAARRAFFEQSMFVNRGIDDRQLFDGDLQTFFIARETGGVLRLDLGASTRLDRLSFRTMDREAHVLDAESVRFADDARLEVSVDLESWRSVDLAAAGRGTIAVARPPQTPIRYVRLFGAPHLLAEIEGHSAGQPLDRTGWRASNLIPPLKDPIAIWSLKVTLDEIVPGALLALAAEGRHGPGKAWAAARVDGHRVGFPDRAPSYPSNTWEYRNVEPDRNTTHYLPLDPHWSGRTIEVYLVVLEGGETDLRPRLYLSASQAPLVRKRLELKE